MNRFILLLISLCLMGFLLVQPKGMISNMEEICDNAIDDDQDGLIDINDPDCTCEALEPTSLIPNPSFEDLNCCPSSRSQLDCAEVWIQASEPTTDLIHSCGWLGWEEFPPPQPFPDGEGIMGFRDGRIRGNNSNNEPEPNWKEYAGACLLNPLEANNLYRFEFDLGFVDLFKSPPINIAFFGTTDCNNLPFGVDNNDFGCPTNGSNWVKLGSTFVSGGDGSDWVKASIEVTPNENIRAIAIGPDCPGVRATESTYYFFDNLLLSDFQSFQFRIAEVEHPCSDNFALTILEDTAFSYQWYKDGIALLEETAAQLKGMHGEGDYQVIVDDGVRCRVSRSFPHRIPVFSEFVSKTICSDEVYEFGDGELTTSGTYVDTFRTEDNCMNIVTLDLKVLGDLSDTVKAEIFQGESFLIGRFNFTQEGSHLVTLSSAIGCDSLVLLELDFFNVYFPNVFSPNADGLNDLFQVQSESGIVQSSELSVFDRWGNLVYQGTEWDGMYKGVPLDTGVYIYIAKLTMNDGIERQFSGEVMLIK